MKKNILFLGLLLAAFLAAGTTAYAGSDHDCGKDKCHKSRCEKKSNSCHKDCESQCPIVSKFFKKACFFLSNKDQIGLSEEQVQTIKGLKLGVQKSALMQEAQMKIFALEADSKMSQTKVDAEGLKAMIDAGMAEFATQAKASVDAYVQLKAVLTDAQMAAAKKIWAEKEKQCQMGADTDKKN